MAAGGAPAQVQPPAAHLLALGATRTAGRYRNVNVRGFHHHVPSRVTRLATAAPLRATSRTLRVLRIAPRGRPSASWSGRTSRSPRPTFVSHGVHRVWLWRAGVDSVRLDPGALQPVAVQGAGARRRGTRRVCRPLGPRY